MSIPFPRKAMVLAAGFGKRLHPLTLDTPKPLIDVHGESMLERMLDLIDAAGIPEAVVNASYLKEQIIERCNDYEAAHPGLSVHLSLEDEPLETGGGIARALPMLGDELFFVCNGDVILVPGKAHPFERLYGQWDDDTDIIMLVVSRANAIGYEGQGDFVALEQGGDVLPAFRRCAKEEEEAPDESRYVFTGVQLIHPRVFRDGILAENTAFSMNVIYNAHQDETGRFERMKAVVHDSAWLHVGDMNGVLQAEAYLAEHTPVIPKRVEVASR